MVFAIHWHESAMGVHVFPILYPPPASLPIPSLRVIPGHRPWVPALFHALNRDWPSISHMVIYMFQWYSLKSSHPWLLPPSPNVCSLHQCLFCCLAYRVIITIFLNSIYMRAYTVLFSGHACLGVHTQLAWEYFSPTVSLGLLEPRVTRHRPLTSPPFAGFERLWTHE